MVPSLAVHAAADSLLCPGYVCFEQVQTSHTCSKTKCIALLLERLILSLKVSDTAVSLSVGVVGFALLLCKVPAPVNVCRAGDPRGVHRLGVDNVS